MNFKDISQNWQNQNTEPSNLPKAELLIQKAKAKTKALQRKKWWTIGILSLTFLVLVFFFFSVGAHQNWSESLGLSLMIFMLLSRISIELFSKHHLQHIDQSLDFQTYVDKLQRYYKMRMWIHYVLTPLIYFAYFGGFVSMLPVFKAELSEGFYLYILISGVVVFIGLALFIVFHIGRELKALELLKQMLKD